MPHNFLIIIFYQNNVLFFHPIKFHKYALITLFLAMTMVNDLIIIITTTTIKLIVIIIINKNIGLIQYKGLLSVCHLNDTRVKGLIQSKTLKFTNKCSVALSKWKTHTIPRTLQSERLFAKWLKLDANRKFNPCT